MEKRGSCFSDPIKTKSAQEAADKIREIHVNVEILLIGELKRRLEIVIIDDE